MLRWSIDNGSCAASFDDVTITFNQVPTVAAAGGDQAVCSATATLAANTPTIGTGQWTIVTGTGGSFADDTDPGTVFTGTRGVTYTLRWTITSGACTPSTDDVVITLEEDPTTAVAGSDQTVCGPATLAGNTPVTGTGQWTVITGTGGVFADDTNPSTVFSGTGGTTYTLRWTISTGSCADSFDEVDITFDINTPTTADAGSDQALCLTTTTLAGNTPVIGTGKWTIVTGTGGSFTDDTNPTTSFTGTAVTTYTLRLTIINGSCTPITYYVFFSM